MKSPSTQRKSNVGFLSGWLPRRAVVAALAFLLVLIASYPIRWMLVGSKGSADRESAAVAESGRITHPCSPPEGTPTYGYRVVRAYPHDRKAFTQGLAYHQGVLYEGTGLRGRSSVRAVALEDGRVAKLRSLPNDIFGEGITVWDDRIVQLSWQAGRGFVYNRDAFELLAEFRYSTEGWGITHDGERFIMSDGSSKLHFLDASSYRPVGQVEVHDDAGPVSRLNELEYVGGAVYANIWQSDRIAKISPASGKVLAWIDLRGLLAPAERHAGIDVLNGIAYRGDNRRLLVTGKNWPKLFEIDLLGPGGCIARP